MTSMTSAHPTRLVALLQEHAPARFPKMLARVLGAAFCVALAAAPSLAQSRAQLDARLRGVENAIRDQEGRLQTLEQDRLTGDPIAERLMERLDSLEAQLSSVTGALERTTLENQQLRSRLATLIREIELRDQQLAGGRDLPPSAYGPFDAESPLMRFDGGAPGPDFGAAAAAGDVVTGAGVAAAPADLGGDSRELGFDAGPETLAAPAVAANDNRAPAGPVTLPETEVAALEYAKDLVIRGQYDQAADALDQFIERFADGDSIAEAWHWRGEVDYVRGLYEGSARAYIRSLEVDPDGPKGPEAMIRLASALNQLGVAEEACATLDDFRRQYRRASPTLQARAERVRAAASCP